MRLNRLWAGRMAPFARIMRSRCMRWPLAERQAGDGLCLHAVEMDIQDNRLMEKIRWNVA
ncbi:hypothetical protein J27TS7_27970 [Paenibacillus dendritiformis]|nr:hypothetical protein J27TS7_27970 [Paenibacillus dendritiformis]